MFPVIFVDTFPTKKTGLTTRIFKTKVFNGKTFVMIFFTAVDLNFGLLEWHTILHFIYYRYT